MMNDEPDQNEPDPTQDSVQLNPHRDLSFPTEQEVTNVLMAVEDPELHINVVDLGLIYKINRNEGEGSIEIDMTLTTPACPYGPQLLGQTHAVVARLPLVKKVKVNPVFTPKWDPRVHATEVGQMMLGLI